MLNGSIVGVVVELLFQVGSSGVGGERESERHMLTFMAEEFRMPDIATLRVGL